MSHGWPVGMRVKWIEGKRGGSVVELVTMSHDLPGYRVRLDRLYKGYRTVTLYESALVAGDTDREEAE